MKANGRLALDTNAVIAYREGISTVCNLINGTDIIFLPVVVLGELMYGAINSSKPDENEKDIWISAICLELNVPLMSSDGHFDNIRNLKVVNWTK